MCDAEIVVDSDVEVGELIECEECGTELEIVRKRPLEVEEAPFEEEDWGE